MLKFILKFFVVLVIAYGIGRLFVVFDGSTLRGVRAPYIQQLTTESVVIRWLSEDHQVGVVRYGASPDHLGDAEVESQPEKNHQITLSNLKPASRYYYQVGSIARTESFDESKHWFITHPETIVPTRIWAIGDSGEPGQTLNQVRDAALGWMKQNPLTEPLVQPHIESSEAPSEPSPLVNIWIALGDIAYRSGTNAQYQASLFDAFEDIVPNTSLWPVYGNHDDRRWTYFRIFDLPENAEAGGVASGTENYYAIDYSNVHFLMLDSQDSSLARDGDMANWIRQDLSANTKPWVIAAFHHPPYTKGSHNSDDNGDSDGRMNELRENILPILEQLGVDLVLSGHSHLYERSYLLDCAYQSSEHFSDKNRVSSGVQGLHKAFIKPLKTRSHQGTVYVVAGSSSKVDQGPLDHPAHHIGLREAGSVVIDVVDKTLTARFINNKGNVSDEFSISRRAGYSSAYSGCDEMSRKNSATE